MSELAHLLRGKNYRDVAEANSRGSGINRAAVGAVVLTTFVLGACGSSSPPKVGDCIDAQKDVVGCNSAAAAQKLVSDLRAPNAIACVQIGNKPQLEVRVDGHPFCAESK